MKYYSSFSSSSSKHVEEGESKQASYLGFSFYTYKPVIRNSILAKSLFHSRSIQKKENILKNGFVYFYFFGYAGSSLQWLLLVQSTGSRHAGFSSCRAGSVVVVHGLLLPSTWDLHRPGIKPLSFASFALQGRFLTTGLPEKPRKYPSIYLSTFLYSPFCIKCPLCFGDVAI